MYRCQKHNMLGIPVPTKHLKYIPKINMYRNDTTKKEIIEDSKKQNVSDTPPRTGEDINIAMVTKTNTSRIRWRIKK